MKKIILFTLVFLNWSGVARSQNISFPAQDAVWKESHITIAGPVFHYYGLCGDTLINGNTYSQVLELQVDTSGAVVGTSYLGGIRSGGPVVRHLPPNSNSEYVLYDFSLQPGNVIELPLWYSDTIVRQVDSVKVELIAGAMRRVVYFKPGYQFAPVEFWMEGIGSNFGLLGRGFDVGGDIGFSLDCFRHGNVFLNLSTEPCEMPILEGCSVVNATDEATYGFSFEIFPNPANEAVTLSWQGAGQDWRCEVYDSRGVLVKTEKGLSPAKSSLPTDDLLPGLYFLKIKEESTGRASLLRKLVIVR